MLKLNNIEVTYLNVIRDNGMRQIFLDSGMNCREMYYVCYIEKSIADSEKWIFTVMDKNRIKDSCSILIRKAQGGTFVPVTAFNVRLGAQNNASYGSFLNLSQQRIFTAGEAYSNQSLVDIIYYYGMYESTLASPAEADAPAIFTGPTGISSWTVKNETRYIITGLTPAEFDNAASDSLLIAAWDPVNAKKKAKYLAKDMIISFQNVEKKKGLIKILDVSGSDTGSVFMNIKIQQ